jgi:hypothetical protein
MVRRSAPRTISSQHRAELTTTSDRSGGRFKNGLQVFRLGGILACFHTRSEHSSAGTVRPSSCLRSVRTIWWQFCWLGILPADSRPWRSGAMNTWSIAWRQGRSTGRAAPLRWGALAVMYGSKNDHRPEGKAKSQEAQDHKGARVGLSCAMRAHHRCYLGLLSHEMRHDGSP